MADQVGDFPGQTEPKGAAPRSRFARSVQSKFLLYVVPLVLVSTVVVFGFFEWNSRRSAEQQLQVKLERLVEIQSAVVAEALWNVAEEQIELILAALLTDSDVLGAEVYEVYDDQYRLVAASGATDQFDNTRFVAQEDILYDAGSEEVRIGSIRIALAETRLASFAQERLSLAVILASILLTAVIAATMAANRRIIGRPLALMMESINQQRSDEPRKLVDWTSDDEIGAVVSAYNEMQLHQNAYEEELRSAADTLEHRVRERTAELALAEKETEQARLQLADAIDSISEGFAIFDAESRLQVANQRYREIMTGDAESTAILDQDLERILRGAADAARFADVGPDPQAWLRELVERHAETDVFIQRTSGDRWQRVSTKRTQSGGSVAVYTDITELKQIQDELESAKDEAEAANEAKSSFLATMSHEIRTPLNGIMGMSSLLDGTALDDEQREFSTTIKSAADTLLTIINDILDFSKVEAGALELERVPLGIGEVVEDCAGLVAAKASEKDIEIACRVASTVPRGILGDPVRLKQILLNLLNNAVKFTEKGEVILSVERIASEDAPTMLRFEVKDTGIGIPADRMDRLFRSFSQVDASTTRRYGGTGLGLVITKRLVELMGGEITVESVEGQGTTFAFTLPTEAADLPDSETRADRMRALVGRRVLLVDDNHTNLLILKDKLAHWNLEATATHDPEEGLRLLTAGEMTFDLCIFDYKMPVLNGFELTRKAREALGDRLPPIVLFTSIAPVETQFRESLDELNFAYVLTKPAKSSHLLNALHRALHGEMTPLLPKAAGPQAGESTELSILLVDDNAINRKVGTKILKRLGYKADLACDGTEAVKMTTEGTYDMVLMDIEMPDIDGITATQQIREKMEAADMPYIVALTANAMASEAARYLESGMDGYLSKPIVIEELIKSLNAAAQHRNPDAPVAGNA